jgi:hypothetical protein
MDTFAESARKLFDFLTADYGFLQGTKHSILPELGDSSHSVRYDAPHIFIWISMDKNEVCVIIFVKIHTSILRPAGTRIFQLGDILRHCAPDFLKSFPESETPNAAPRNFEDFLRFYAGGLRQYCDPLLRMDLKQLEDISRNEHK